MRILVVLTYYRPHISGLTIYAERLARAWARRGHQVTVLTSQYLPELPREEMMDGVRIVRAPVLFRLSKGVIMPTFGALASKLVMENDVIQLHLPQFDAARHFPIRTEGTSPGSHDRSARSGFPYVKCSHAVQVAHINPAIGQDRRRPGVLAL